MILILTILPNQPSPNTSIRNKLHFGFGAMLPYQEHGYIIDPLLVNSALNPSLSTALPSTFACVTNDFRVHLFHASYLVRQQHSEVPRLLLLASQLLAAKTRY